MVGEADADIGEAAVGEECLIVWEHVGGGTAINDSKGSKLGNVLGEVLDVTNQEWMSAS